jgi:hypothetical protein
MRGQQNLCEHPRPRKRSKKLIALFILGLSPFVKGVEQDGKRVVRRSSAQLSALPYFRPPSRLLPQFTVCRATAGCEEDCLTLDTVVSNSNEDSEQRQTKV